jgi:hypothetical protein
MVEWWGGERKSTVRSRQYTFSESNELPQIFTLHIFAREISKNNLPPPTKSIIQYLDRWVKSHCAIILGLLKQRKVENGACLI